MKAKSFNSIINDRILRVRPFLNYIFCEPQWFIRQYKQFKTTHWKHFTRNKNKRKNYFIILIELIRTAWSDKMIPFHYFRYALYMKYINKSKMDEFMGESVYYYRYLPYMSNDTNLLDDKNIFSDILFSADIRMPLIIIRKRSNSWRNIYNNIIDDQSAYNILLTSELNEFFCKPAHYSSGGNDVFVIVRRNGLLYVDDKILNTELMKSLFEDDWIIQERLKNSKQINRYNRHALNCLRVITALDSVGYPYAMYTSMKLASGTGLTDNGANGLVYIAVDMNTGQLHKFGYNDRYDELEKHPNSDMYYTDLTIDCISEAINLCLKGALYFPKCKVIGWDVAITDDGPILIEGNSSVALTSIQKPHFGIKELKDYVIREYRQAKSAKTV